ncbi:uncharacterized protein LOC124145987 [Haliotis rufescens]|uniref:uncharacterized protein LOC124145987 n=1 Tax=Haliotis rufescens TaxID=6454 RepID=UPI00201F322F|nr:uncharacterized protein LOC124145987 [Haliotis rufescens]
MALQLVLILVLLSLVDAHSDHWVYDVLFDQQQNLTCDNDVFNPDRMPTGTTLLWTLPSGEIIRPHDDHSKIDISSSGHWILVKHVQDEDFGVYNCLVFVQGNLTYSIRKGINIHGPYWGDLTKKYIPSVVVGAIAAAVTFAILSFLCFWYERHQGKGEGLIDKYEATRRAEMSEDGGQLMVGMHLLRKSSRGCRKKMGLSCLPLLPNCEDIHQLLTSRDS